MMAEKSSYQTTQDILVWDYMPDARDGATNCAVASGVRPMTNVGPFVLTYNKALGHGTE